MKHAIAALGRAIIFLCKAFAESIGYFFWQIEEKIKEEK